MVEQNPRSCNISISTEIIITNKSMELITVPGSIFSIIYFSVFLLMNNAFIILINKIKDRSKISMKKIEITYDSGEKDEKSYFFDIIKRPIGEMNNNMLFSRFARNCNIEFRLIFPNVNNSSDLYIFEIELNNEKENENNSI